MTQNKIFKSIATFLLVLSILFSSLPTQGQNKVLTSKSTSNTKPRLVLLIVVDQFRYDYLERFDDLFGAGGFKRLTTNGAFFTNANYDYVPTYTAPGHAA